MKKLVIYNGAQFDADNLPAGIDPKQCVPIDDWFAQNRTGPSSEAATAPKAPAKKTARSSS